MYALLLYYFSVFTGVFIAVHSLISLIFFVATILLFLKVAKNLYLKLNLKDAELVSGVGLLSIFSLAIAGFFATSNQLISVVPLIIGVLALSFFITASF